MQKQSGYKISKPIRFLSLFSGIGGFEKGITSVFPNAKCVGFSEINKFPISVYKSHFPGHKNIGDIALVVWKHDKNGEMLADKKDRPILNKKALRKLPDFDLLVGGSPCQGLSGANITRRELADPRSRLFYAFLQILRFKKPEHFILENVASMSKHSREVITKLLGVDSIEINSDLVTAQGRKRYYWCSWKLKAPKDRKIFFEDIREKKFSKKYYCSEKESEFITSVAINPKTNWNITKGFKKDNLFAYSRSIRDIMKDGKKIGSYDERRFRKNGKANTLVTGKGCGGSHAKNYIMTKKGKWRLLTLSECARLQSFPDDWCEIISQSQAYKAYGNAVTVEVIVEIMKQHPSRKVKRKKLIKRY